MVQIIEENRRPRADIGQALSGIVQAYGQMQMQQEQKRAQAAQVQQENATVNRLTGLDISGIQDPKMRQKALELSLQGQFEKGPTSLQKSQQALNEEKLKALQGRQDLFKRLTGESSEEKRGTSQDQQEGSPQQNALSGMPEDNLTQLSAFAGQPGEEGVIGNIAKTELDRRREEQKADRKERMEFHKESAKFDEKLTDQSNAAENKIKAIQRQRKIQPNISNWDRFVSATFKGHPLENVIKSSSAQEFDANALPMVEGQKETFGVRLSDADLRLITQKIATSDKSPEANNAIMDWMEFDERLKIEKRKIADQIRKENKNFRPIDYESQIRNRMNEKYGDEIDKKSQAILSLPDNSTKYTEITGRQKVAPGTILTPDIAKQYLLKTNRDMKAAEEMAKEDGYTW